MVMCERKINSPYQGHYQGERIAVKRCLCSDVECQKMCTPTEPIVSPPTIPHSQQEGGQASAFPSSQGDPFVEGFIALCIDSGK